MSLFDITDELYEISLYANFKDTTVRCPEVKVERCQLIGLLHTLEVHV
jgi:hypothetical protein